MNMTEPITLTAAERRYQRRRWIHSYHEAGHVIRSVAWQLPVSEVSILARGDGSKFLVGTGTFRSAPGPDVPLVDLYMGLCISAAGEAAERRYRLGTRKRLTAREEANVRDGARGDHENIRTYYSYVPREHLDEAFTWQTQYVDRWIEEPETWQGIQLMAQAIYDQGELNAWQIGAVLQTWAVPQEPAA